MVRLEYTSVVKVYTTWSSVKRVCNDMDFSRWFEMKHSGTTRYPNVKVERSEPYYGLTKVFVAEVASVVAVTEMGIRVLADVPTIATSSTTTLISTCRDNGKTLRFEQGGPDCAMASACGLSYMVRGLDSAGVGPDGARGSAVAYRRQRIQMTTAIIPGRYKRTIGYTMVLPNHHEKSTLPMLINTPRDGLTYTGSFLLIRNSSLKDLTISLHSSLTKHKTRDSKSFAYKSTKKYNVQHCATWMPFQA